MNDTAHLRIQVSDNGIESATSGLKRLESQSGRTERATGGLSRSAARLATRLIALASVTAALNKLTTTARNFDIINASLITSTGSAENAKVAFDALIDFATTTPYQLETVSNSFIKLVNYGLTPSERALTSYGNTAAAMGKDLEQLVEAVADAATGEFERLKEFGIKSANEGDQIAFRFRGVTTRVRNNAEEIENYIIGLGENEFAGAMDQRMDTLDGALSNLSDSWNKLFLTISNAGVGAVIENAARGAIVVLEELSAIIESGQLSSALDYISHKFKFIPEGASVAYQLTSDATEWLNSKMTGDFSETFDMIERAFKYMPENIRAAILIAAAHIQALPDQMRYAFYHMSNTLEEYGTYMATRADIFGAQIRAAFTLDGEALGDLAAQAEQAERIRNGAIAGSSRRMNDNMARRADMTAQIIADIRAEQDANIELSDEKLAQIGKTREEYNKMMEERARLQGDRLERFFVGGTPEEEETAADVKARKDAIKAAERREQELQRIQDYLYTEEEALKASYDRRREIVINNTSEESELRGQLLSKLSVKYEEETATLRESQMADIEALRESLYTQEEAIEASYQRRRDIVLENTLLTGEEKNQLEVQLEKERADALQKIEVERQNKQLKATSDFFGNLSVLQQSENSKMAAIGKAAAIAQATIRTYESATAAYSAMAGIPVVGPSLGAAAAAAAVAAGLANVAQIKSTNAYAGAYDAGGHIPAGKYAMVGEVGPELVRGPANVTSRVDTAKLGNNQGSVVIHFSPQVTIEANGQSMDPENAQRFGDQINERLEYQFLQLMQREMGPNGILDRWRA